MSAMNLKRLRLHNVTCYDELDLEFPERGIITVTGENGSGKSTLVEALSFAVWGKTMRGTPAWRPDPHGSISLETYDGLSVLREQHKGRVTFTWDIGGQGTTYETPTKAQDALIEVVGDWDVWRRSSVFSSADAAHFTLSTDAERKRLLEAIVIGDTRFDEGLEQCRLDLRKARDRCAQLAAVIDQGMLSVTSEARRLDEATKTLGMHAVTAVDETLAAQLVRGKTLLVGIDNDMRPLVAKSRAAQSAGGENAGLIAGLKKALERLRAETCPTCTQPIPQKLRDDLQERTECEEHKATAAVKKARDDIVDIDLDLDNLREERTELARRIERMERELNAARRSATVRAQLETVIESAKANMAAHTAEVQVAQAAIDESTADVKLLEVVEIVLGTRGIRAHILGKALSGLEAVANAWLGRIAGKGLSLSLSPYTEKKTGGTSDAIGLAITGAGAGYGYRATSGGERRRVDVALVWALGEVAAAAHGRVPGTLFADEVFDALDEDGTMRAVDALHELAADRVVVVISHSRALVGSMRAVAHWHVEGGKIHCG